MNTNQPSTHAIHSNLSRPYTRRFDASPSAPRVPTPPPPPIHGRQQGKSAREGAKRTRTRPLALAPPCSQRLATRTGRGLPVDQAAAKKAQQAMQPSRPPPKDFSSRPKLSSKTKSLAAVRGGCSSLRGTWRSCGAARPAALAGGAGGSTANADWRRGGSDGGEGMEWEDDGDGPLGEHHGARGFDCPPDWGSDDGYGEDDGF